MGRYKQKIALYLLIMFWSAIFKNVEGNCCIGGLEDDSTVECDTEDCDGIIDLRRRSGMQWDRPRFTK